MSGTPRQKCPVYAILDETETVVLCGRTGCRRSELAEIRASAFEPDERRCYLPPGSQATDDGAWKFSSYAAERQRQGKRPMNKDAFISNPDGTRQGRLLGRGAGLPIRFRCPRCSAVNILDPVRLNAAAGHGSVQAWGQQVPDE